jgi:photosystem II stability/assembly factor-like uncharacterized protein
MVLKKNTFQNMKKINTGFLFVCVFILSGCIPGLGTSKSGPSNGGIARSADGGVTFERLNAIVVDGEGSEAASTSLSLARTDITSLVIDPQNSAIIYAGTARQGLFVSADAGQSWKNMTFAGRSVADLAIDPRDSAVIYAAAPWEGRGSLFKSIDSGQSWERVYVEPIEGTEVTTVLLHPQIPGEIYIGTSINASRKSAIVRSRDGGVTWDNIRTNEATVRSIHFDPKNQDQMYFFTSRNVIWRSADHGRSWESVSALKRPDKDTRYSGTVQSFLVHPRTPGELYVGTDRSLYRSENYGDTWAEVDIIGSSKGIPIRAISVSPISDNQITYASARALYVLAGSDGETNRWKITDTQSQQIISAIIYDPNDPRVMYVGFQGLK